MKTLRLGPLGAPLAIVLAWVAVRVAILSVPVDAPQLNKPAAIAGPVARHPAVLPSQAISAPPPIAIAVNRPVHRPSTPREIIRATRSAGSRPVGGMMVPVLFKPDTPPLFRGRSGTVAGEAARRRGPHRGFSGSSWTLLNGTGGAIGVPSLGGSQAGVRIFLQGGRAPLALTARVSRALGAQRDAEVSAGYGLRVRGFGLLVERRERLEVRSGAFVATVYGGVYDVRLPGDLRFDGFAQGGVVGVRQRRWFSDGQARITRRAALSAEWSLGAGGGAWASAQQGARRVEAGPLIEARIRSGTTGMRIAGEYRFRLTGDALPRSGPALTVGVDF